MGYCNPDDTSASHRQVNLAGATDLRVRFVHGDATRRFQFSRTETVECVQHVKVCTVRVYAEDRTVTLTPASAVGSAVEFAVPIDERPRRIGAVWDFIQCVKDVLSAARRDDEDRARVVARTRVGAATNPYADAWLVDYNEVCPHSTLNYLTPKEFAEALTTQPIPQLPAA